MTVQLAMEPPTDDRAGFAYPLDQAAHRVRMALFRSHFASCPGASSHRRG